MHTFVVASAKPGRSVPPNVTALLHDGAPAELTFAPDDHLVWSDDTDRTWFAGWQANAAALGVGSRWDVRPDGLTAFTGHVWHRATAWSGRDSWATQLADLTERKPLEQIASDLDGLFSAVSIARDGRGCVTADPLGFAILYTAETPDLFVISNRASLAARAVSEPGREPGRDAEGIGWLIYASTLMTDRTTFEGVRTLPQGSVIRLDPSFGPVVHTWAARPWLGAPSVDRADLPEAIEEAFDHLRSLIRLFATIPARMRTMELTGGHDSRLILSLLLAEGVADRFVHITWGSKELKDVVVATAIADHFGLNLRASTRPSLPGMQVAAQGSAGSTPLTEGRSGGRRDGIAADFETQVRHHVWLRSGGQSIWDLTQVGRPSSPNLALTGLIGEVIRTNYAKTGGVASFADLKLYFTTGQFGYDGAALLRPEVRRHYDERTVELLESVLPAGGSPQDAVDGLYQIGRLRRWLGAGQETDTRNRLFPLYSMPAIRLAFALGSGPRHAEAVPFELMTRSCDDLARMPFAGAQWAAGAPIGRVDAASYPTEPPVPRWRPPVLPPQRSLLKQVSYRLRSRTTQREEALPSPHGSARWPSDSAVEVSRMRDVDKKVPVLRDFLDLDRNHAFYDLVDRKALDAALAGFAHQPVKTRRGVHDAVTAAIWLSGAESRGDRSGP